MQISLPGTSNKLFARLSPFIGTQVHTARQGRAPGIICRCWRRKCDQIFAGNSPGQRINIYWTSRNLRCNPMRSISLWGEGKKRRRKKEEREKEREERGEKWRGWKYTRCCGTKKNSTFGHVFEIIWRYEYCFRFLAVIVIFLF